MRQLRDLEASSIDELWKLHETVSELLTAKMRAEKEKLEDRLRLLPTATDLPRTRRPYPPVLPKFANPDAPQEVWSGRGRKPRWVAEKLSSGFELKDLSMAAPQKS
jgi:DNA-binding protein H-NS